MIGEVIPAQIEVNGQVLTAGSTLSTLRAACTFYKVSRSGSKMKCYHRLCQHQKELELLMAQSAIAQAEGVAERHPNAQRLVKPPEAHEQELHALTHTPYAPWCSSCLKHRARPDQHKRTGEAHDTPIPVISMDFAITKKKEGLDPHPEGEVDDKGALWLVLTDSHTGYLGVVPIQSKGQLNYMTHEVLSFVQGLGYAEVGFYGDNEPTIRQILKTIITSRHALGLKTRIYTTKVKDSAGNALVENSIQRIRQLACTLMEDVYERTGLVFPCEHALWSWAGRHAAWCLNRFQVGKSMTSYEVTHGKRYNGKTACFAEPVYAYCKGRGKADAKWRVGLMLGKTEAQDAWIIGDGVDVMLSRSIRRVDQPWSRFLAYYSGLQTHSFVYQTNFGGRIVPTKRKITPQKQEGRLLPKMSEVERRFADEEANAVLAYARSREGRLEAQREVKEALAELPDQPPPGVAVQVEEPPQLSAQVQGDSQMSSTPGQPSNAALLAQPSSPRMSSTRSPEFGTESLGQEESSAKRTRHEENVLRRIAMIERRLVEVTVGEEKFYHLDKIIDQEYLNAVENDEGDEKTLLQVNNMEKLWSDDPLTRAPPDPDPGVDHLAAEVELQRLQDMGVIEPLGEGDGGLSLLTTRMVYDWRIKDWMNPTTKEVKRRWMRRGRLVAREYANQRRDDVHSPASGGQVLRLLPSIYLMMLGVDGVPREELQIGALDVKDAFLMASQEEPVQITTTNGKFKVKKNLPGQRLAAKAWYDYLVSFLKKRGVEFSKENPCVGKRAGRLFLLLHVDDMMICGCKDEVQKLIAELKTEFVIAYKLAQFPGDEFEFLKRTYRLCDDGMDIMPGRYGETMVKLFEERYGAVKCQQVPCGDEAQEISSTVLLPEDEASLYRSLVGSGIYLSQERIELGYVIKQLAGGMSSPTCGHLQVMKRLIGYLKATLGNYNHLDLPTYGKGIHHQYDSKWVLESFTDSDWSGDRTSRRSTSSCVHCLNGIIIFHSSRGQKVVSLSSAEAELHGLVSGATDGIALRICLEFLMDVKVFHICLMDNSATRQIANKRGSGRLRHVSGKLLWVQDQTSSKTMEVKQISTLLNIGDIGTKPLGKSRLQALMFWCKIYNKDGTPIGEDEASRVKEANINKAKIMRVAKLLQKVVILGGLEQAYGELIPFRMDLETIIPVEEQVWFSFGTLFFLFFIAVLVGFFIMYKVFTQFQREVREELAEIRTRQNRIQAIQNELVLESGLQHTHVTAMHVSLVRLGGYINLRQEITEQDWDNWYYIERGNQQEDDRVCRRGLRALRKVTRTRQRRHATPARADRDGADYDYDEDAPENMSPEEYQRRMDSSNPEDWPGESRAERRQRYLQSTMSECSDPDEWMALHHGDAGRDVFLGGDASRSRDGSGGENGDESGEESTHTDDAVSDKDTVVSEYMKEEYLEWPSYDFSSSQDRAQLSALQWIRDWSVRQARAIRDGNDRLAAWCNQQIGVHRIYSRVGAITLNN